MRTFWATTTLALLAGSGIQAADYLVAVPESTAKDPAWSAAADSLAAKHHGTRVDWNGKPADLLPLLTKHQPRWLAVVGKPQDFDASFVRALHRVSRQIDADPWSDTRWGLITGASAADVMRIVDTKEPLVIERGLTTTGVDFSLLKSGVTLSDGGKGGWTEKLANGTMNNGTWTEQEDANGTIGRFVKAWNTTKPQLLVSSSHATQYNLEMPYGLGLIASHAGKFHVLSIAQRQDFAKFLGGAMFTGDAAKLGAWLDSLKTPVLDPQPDVAKVWVAAGNCLIGDTKRSTDSMVTTAMGAGGVRQFVGYVVPTWFGRAGWGTLGLWQANRGALSLADAFHLNQQKLVDETRQRFPKAMAVDFDCDDIESAMHGADPGFGRGLEKLQKEGTKIEKDLVGLVHDRDVVALWGDPKWAAVFRPERGRDLVTSWQREKDGTQVLRLTSAKGFEGEVTDFLPARMKSPRLEGPADAVKDSVVADDFVLFRKLKVEAGKALTIRIVETKESA